jgi:hypothetical protein
MFRRSDRWSILARRGHWTAVIERQVSCEASMTLIVSAWAKTAVVQVSDRRLTGINERIPPKNAVKTMHIRCRDATFALSYTGLATPKFGQALTMDTLLIDELSSRNAHALRLEEIHEQVARKLTDVISSYPAQLTHKGLTVVLVGHDTNGHFKSVITNIENGHKSLAPSGRRGNSFYTHVERPIKGVRERRARVWIHGAVEALSTGVREQIKHSEERMFYESHELIVQRLVDIVRTAANHKKHGRVIGSDCSSIVIPDDDGLVIPNYHPAEPSNTTYYPHSIQRTGRFSVSFADVKTVWTPDPK